jgi:predicted porin
MKALDDNDSSPGRTAMKRLVMVLLAAAPLSAFAGGGSNLDIYYVPSAKIDSSNGGSAPDNSHGYGIKGTFNFAPSDDRLALFVTGEYAKNTYEGDNSGVHYNAKLTDWRAGAGLGTQQFYARAEYISFKGETTASAGAFSASGNSTDTGWGAHVGAHADVWQGLNVEGEVGYADVGDSGHGLEWTAGASYAFTPGIGVFVDYRWTKLKDDNGNDGTLKDVRTGVRFLFGGA